MKNPALSNQLTAALRLNKRHLENWQILVAYTYVKRKKDGQNSKENRSNQKKKQEA